VVLKTTAYAEQLLDDMKELVRWPERVLTMQQNWIGKSVGTFVDFTVNDLGSRCASSPRVWTRFSAVAPCSWRRNIRWWRLFAGEFQGAHAGCGRRWSGLKPPPVRARVEVNLAKVGADTGFTSAQSLQWGTVPIWLANFVLMEYGTGAIMAVPAHDERDFEFCSRLGCPIRTVIVPEGERAGAHIASAARPTIEYGRLVNSGPYTGLTSEEAIERMTRDAEERDSAKGRFSIASRTGEFRASAIGARPFP
jgi:leucyl-tRNA synthetase